MSRTHTLVAVLASLVVVGALPACSAEPPDGALKSFLTAWERGTLAGQRNLLSDDGQPLAGSAARDQLTAIAGELATQPPKLTLKGKPTVRGAEATATVAVAWPVGDGVVWRYDTTVGLRRKDNGWRVFFDPRTVHPELGATDKLVVKRTPATRGSILDGAGQPLVTNRPVVVVGIEPQRVQDLAYVTKTLNAAFTQAGVPGIDLSTLPTRVQNAKPDAFVTVVTLRKEVFDKVADWLRTTAGVVTRETTQSLAPNAPFARALLGTADEVTKDVMDANPGKYRVGDVAGLAGLQRRYDDLLRGTPGVTVAIALPKGVPDKKLFTSDPKPGGSLTTTLDARTQTAAESALAGETRRSALVAVRVSDGAILAVANGPGAAANNFALLGQTPPGSTFKTVTALALLNAGTVGLDTPVDCPKTATIGGRTFHNAHDVELGRVPLRAAFAQSCNTTFAALAPRLGDHELAKTAQALGIGIPWDLGTDAFTGTVSTGGDAVERAAAAFGQGTTVVSPVSLAGAAAAVARGQWKQPSLVLDPAPTKRAADWPPLQPASVDAVRTMMREVVTGGTAKQLAGLPGDLRGKTGTAEYDNVPEHAHSWFMGYRGDIAFCAFVENGGASTEAAVPMIGRFFQALG
jgi:cell division protein FtsI/penicillin-binding protein 2